jgi:diguanylate cyclase (GGDEF)-like protein
MPPVPVDPAAPPRSWRTWKVWDFGRGYTSFLFGVEAIAVVLCGVGLAQTRPSVAIVLRIVLLLALCLIFEETARRMERTRIMLSDRRAYTDMTSVWAIAAIVTVPAGYAMALIMATQGYLWLRRGRLSLALPHRELFTTATMLLSCAAAAQALAVVGAHLDALPRGIDTAAIVVIALAIYTLVNRGLIFVAVYLASGGKGKMNIIGTWQENSLEVATLCLGALTALALLYQPWLVVLALPPMFSLARGALVTELEQAASTDSKTGLLNALAWHQVAKREIARSERLAKPGAVLLIDLDHFKVVNDTHGHLIGDAVLAAVAQSITSELRDYDAVGRFGGEEFVAILPDVDVPTAIAISDRVRRRIAGLLLSNLDGASMVSSITAEHSLTASIGLAHYPAHGTDIESLLHAADTALYVAKRSGRNKVVLADRSTAEDLTPLDVLR